MRTPRRHGWPGGRDVAVLATQLAIAAALVLAWQLSESASTTISAFIGSPAGVVHTLRDWLLGPDYAWSDIWDTVKVTFTGLALGCGTAVAGAFLLSQLSWLSRFLNPFVAFANMLPKVAFIPVFVLWFGIGDLSKILFVAVGVFFIVFYSVFTALGRTERARLDNLRVLGASRFWVARELLLPTAWGALVSSIRLSVAFSLLGAVLTQMLGANEGLGYLLAEGQGNLSPDQVVAAILIVAVVGAVLDVLLAAADRRVARWRKS